MIHRFPYIRSILSRSGNYLYHKLKLYMSLSSRYVFHLIAAIYNFSKSYKLTDSCDGNVQAGTGRWNVFWTSRELLHSFVCETAGYLEDPGTGHFDTGFVGFSLSSSKYWDGSQVPNCHSVFLMQPSQLILIKIRKLCLWTPQMYLSVLGNLPIIS